jgi:hypothetical protein
VPQFRITDQVTGKTVTVSGDSAPTDAEAQQIFADAGLHSAPPAAAPGDNWSNIGAENLRQAGIKPSPAPPVSTPVDMARSIPGGLAQGAAGIIGLPGDALDAASSTLARLMGQIVPGSSPWVKGALDLQGRTVGTPLPTTAQANEAFSAPTGGYYQPQTIPGKITETAASFAPAAIGPGGVAAKAARVLVPAFASEAAGELSKGTSAEPYARGGAALLTGGLTSLATDPAVLSSIASAARSVGPITAKGAERMAAERLAGSASDLPAAQAALNAPLLLVPGGKPTTGQLTGDMGILGLEREAQTLSPGDFQQRRADQNSARLSQLNALQPEGSPADLSDYVKGQMRSLDEQTDQTVASATQAAQQRVEQLGGTLPREQYGATLRAAAQQASDEARKREHALWHAVDPDGNLTVNTTGIRDAATAIQDSITMSAKPPTGDEERILITAHNYGHLMPFRDVGDLRASVNDAMRQELRANGQTQAYARLVRMRGAVENAVHGAIDQRAQAAPENLRAALTGYEQLQHEATQWTAGRAGAGANVASGTGGISPVYGNEGPSVRQPGNSAGYSGVQGAPTFDSAAAERLRLASQATRDRADRFGRGPVGQVLAKAGRQDQYKVSDASVPAKVFQPGPTGFEAVQAYRKAVGDDSAMLTLQDYAASNLRHYAGNSDGTLDPAKVQTWTQRHADALRAFPELGQRFQDASSASAAIGDAMSARRSALDAYQTGAIAKIVGLSNPDDVTRAVGGVLNSQSRVQQMQQLTSAARRDPSALAGLRKCVADYIQKHFVGNIEAATTGEGTIKADAFQTFIRQNETALGTIFNPDEIRSLKAVAADLQRSNRSLSAVKIPGQSNTAQDLATLQNGQPSILRRLLIQGAGAIGGAAAGMATATGATLPAMAGWLGVKTIAALRDAGMTRVDDILKNALLNPEVAKALLEKVPAKPDTGGASRLATALRRSALIGSALGTTAASQARSDQASAQLNSILANTGTPAWQNSMNASAMSHPMLLLHPGQPRQ